MPQKLEDGVFDVNSSHSNLGEPPIKAHKVSRRQFLEQTSLGAAGLMLAANSIFAKDNPGTNQTSAVSEADLTFVPIRYRPIPAKVMGLGQRNVILLDGMWRIDANPGQNIRTQPLNAANWGNFQVPGQWAQQGYDIPRDKTAAVARELTVPAEWAGFRVFLRFDAIHSGTNYWLNGQLLGYSENLFTPVEWEITNFAKFGQPNRLDLEMKVATASEHLSNSCVYTGYSLGGIDRTVRLYALPKVHVSTLHLNAGLDKDYRDGELQVVLGLDNPDQSIENNFSIGVEIFDATGKSISHSTPKVALDSLKQGQNTVMIESRVANPRKWNAEQPNLYKLVLSLNQGGKVLEQVERNIGFRTIEAKDRQLFVNGVRVKLAGVCRHEIDPLTGRAATKRHAEEDVKRFKYANLNLVRTSHYPPTQEFLDAADRYGLYIESEAPLCWLQSAKDLKDLEVVLKPTSAMVDYNHWHPSIIMWSLANESHWSGLFTHSDSLVKRLDPTRPTTLEHAFSNEDKATVGIISRHYQNMPYDEILKTDTRPFLHGECFFLVYHERTDVAINPGLRELWAAGSADLDSAWGKACVENLKGKKGLIPGIYPGAWSYIYASKHCIGSEIWSGVDDIAYLPGAKVASSENGNAYWGLVDGWRRSKPELELARFVFAPVWFPVRQLEYQFGQLSVSVPVENRYSFTDLSQFEFIWEVEGQKGRVRTTVAPASSGRLDVSLRTPVSEGSRLLVRVMNGSREVINATLALGARQPSVFPQPSGGAPKWSDDGKLITIEGRGFSLVLDRSLGDFATANPKHAAPIKSFPSFHATRHDYGDLESKKPLYAVLPDAKTRVIENVSVAVVGDALELIVKDHYDHFAGTIRWRLDRDGAGRISYDYTYTGADLDSREVGISALLSAQCDKLQWRRWSEWGIFPDDCICRTEGSAMARRNAKWPDQPANVKPAWPWSQDQTELGTADFRSIKFCIYEASLVAPDGSGIRAESNADAHFRSCLTGGGVKMHILSQCPLAPVALKTGTQLTGEFSVHLLASARSA